MATNLSTALPSPSDHTSMVSVIIFVVLLCACIMIGQLFKEDRRLNVLITALLIGYCSGYCVLDRSRGQRSHLLVFREDLFLYFLPPIMFNAGFQVKKKHFFRNFLTIMLFGTVGALISFTIISLGVTQFFKRMHIGSLDIGDYLAIGAIFAATNSVCTLQALNRDETPLLYGLVFGGGVVNDATSVVLFNAIRSFDLTHINPRIGLQFIGNFVHLFSKSTLLGVIAGLISAYIIRKLCLARQSTDCEVALMMLVAFLSYLMAELFHLSGILTVFFCGIVMARYTWHNVTSCTRVTTKHTFATLSSVAEICIFLYIGMDALDVEKWRFVCNSPGTSVAVISVLLTLLLVGRAAYVFPLSFLSNLTKKTAQEKINFKEQIVIWWSGLMKGAVSMALAYNQFTRSGHTKEGVNAIMIYSTIIVVLLGTMVFGLPTKPLLRFLLPHPKQKRGLVCTESFTEPLPAEKECSLDEYTFLTTPTSVVHRVWRRFDNVLMRPVFGGRGVGFGPLVTSSPTE